MYAIHSHSYTHLILALGIVREPTIWVFITSKYPGIHDIGLPNNAHFDWLRTPRPRLSAVAVLGEMKHRRTIPAVEVAVLGMHPQLPFSSSSSLRMLLLAMRDLLVGVYIS